MRFLILFGKEMRSIRTNPAYNILTVLSPLVFMLVFVFMRMSVFVSMFDFSRSGLLFSMFCFLHWPSLLAKICFLATIYRRHVMGIGDYKRCVAGNQRGG